MARSVHTGAGMVAPMQLLYLLAVPLASAPPPASSRSACALVFAGAWPPTGTSSGRGGGGSATPLLAFCSSAATTSCTAGSSPATTVSRQCDSSDPHLYIQNAIYAAAGRDSNGHRLHPTNTSTSSNKSTVLLSAGTHVLDTALACWYPFGLWTALHVPSNVSLVGSRSPTSGTVLKLHSTCVKLSAAGGSGGHHHDQCAGPATPLDNFVLISDYRVGSPTLSTDEFLAPAVDSSLESLAIEAPPGSSSASSISTVVNAVVSRFVFHCLSLQGIA